MSSPTTPTVQAVDTSFRIIEALHEQGESRVSEIAEMLDKPVSTVHNHLRTLEENGYVLREEEQYRIGFRFLELGGYIRSHTDLYLYGRPEVDRLAKETGELANIMIEEQGLGVHLYLAKGDNAISFDAHAGRRFYLHNTALGKAILAHLPEARVNQIIERHGLPQQTENTISNQEELFEELTTIRERGYATDNQERVTGERCIAAPVLSDGELVGSVSVSGPASRMKAEKFEQELPEKVIQAADLIGINIKYDQP